MADPDKIQVKVTIHKDANPDMFLLINSLTISQRSKRFYALANHGLLLQRGNIYQQSQISTEFKTDDNIFNGDINDDLDKLGV